MGSPNACRELAWTLEPAGLCSAPAGRAHNHSHRICGFLCFIVAQRRSLNISDHQKISCILLKGPLHEPSVSHVLASHTARRLTARSVRGWEAHRHCQNRASSSSGVPCNPEGVRGRSL